MAIASRRVNIRWARYAPHLAMALGYIALAVLGNFLDNDSNLATGAWNLHENPLIQFYFQASWSRLAMACGLEATFCLAVLSRLGGNDSLGRAWSWMFPLLVVLRMFLFADGVAAGSLLQVLVVVGLACLMPLLSNVDYSERAWIFVSHCLAAVCLLGLSIVVLNHGSNSTWLMSAVFLAGVLLLFPWRAENRPSIHPEWSSHALWTIWSALALFRLVEVVGTAGLQALEGPWKWLFAAVGVVYVLIGFWDGLRARNVNSLLFGISLTQIGFVIFTVSSQIQFSGRVAVIVVISQLCSLSLLSLAYGTKLPVSMRRVLQVLGHGFLLLLPGTPAFIGFSILGRELVRLPSGLFPAYILLVLLYLGAQFTIVRRGALEEEVSVPSGISLSDFQVLSMGATGVILAVVGFACAWLAGVQP